MSTLNQCPNCKSFNCFHKPVYHRSAWKLPSRKSSLYDYLRFIGQFIFLDLLISWGIWISVMYLLLWLISFIGYATFSFIDSDTQSKTLEVIFHNFQSLYKVSPESSYYFGISILWGFLGIWLLIITYHVMSFINLFDFDQSQVFNRKYLLFFNRIYGWLSFNLLKKSSIVKKTKTLSCKECGITIPSDQIYNFKYLLDDAINNIRVRSIQEEVKQVNQLISNNDYIVNGDLLEKVWQKHDEVKDLSNKEILTRSIESTSKYLWNDGLLRGLINQCFNCANDVDKIDKAQSLVRFLRNNRYYETIDKICTTIWADTDSKESN